MINNRLTVIVPIYNSENYIERLISSLLKQKYGDMEILLINDGSTDGSLSICQKYEKIDKRIRVINKENGGVSSCRNCGIELATGSYLTFVDSDDYIDTEAYMKCMKVMLDTDVDLLKFSYYKENDKGRIKYDFKMPTDSVIEFDIKTYIENVFNTKDFEAVWNIIVKKDIIDRHEIRFDEQLIVAEDFKFINECLSRSRKIFIMSDAFYHYVINPESATQKYDSNKVILRCNSIVKSYIDSTNIYEINIKDNTFCLEKINKLLNDKIMLLAVNESFNSFKIIVKKINSLDTMLELISTKTIKEIPTCFLYYLKSKVKGKCKIMAKRIIYR